MAKTDSTSTKERSEKEVALKFFELISAGKPSDARSLFATECVHHNPYLPAGMDALLESIAQVQKGGELSFDMSENMRLEIKHVMAEGNLVAVHTTVQSTSDKSKGLRQIHLFRFSADKIVEYWDVTQMAPENSPNAY